MYENDAMQCKAIDPNAEAIGFFKKYVQAKAEFDEACRAVQNAQNRREVAAKALTEINQRVMETAQRAMNDPTMPEPAQIGNTVTYQSNRF
jgi:hypothetical protein